MRIRKSITVPLLLLVAFQPCFGQTSFPAKASNAEPIKAINKDWLKEVKQNIRQQEYHISKKAGAKAWQSPNRGQDLHLTYKPDQVRMQPLTNKNKESDWQLKLKTMGLYADGQKVQGTNKKAEAQVEDSMVVFRHGRMKIQYLNRKQGLRQNFIVKELSEKPETLEVRLKSTGLRIKKAGKKELQFFKEETDKKQLTYEDLKVWDANGRILPARFETKDQNIQIHVKTSNAEYPITIDPLSTTPDWTDTGRKAAARFGGAVANAGDVNGDGYDDIIVGAHLYDNPNAGPGRVFVYHGSQDGLSTSPDWFAKNNSSEGGWYFGVRVSTAGDVNSDGYDDVIVAKPNHSAYVYHGSRYGLSKTPDWKISRTDSSKGFASDVASAGDVNGDGYDDVIIGYDEGGPNRAGRALVYRGSSAGLSTSPTWSAHGIQEDELFGNAVATAGDINNDGYDDVIIGAEAYNDQQGNKKNVGRAYVFTGSRNGLSNKPVWQNMGEITYSLFGNAVSAAGDVNGDGYDDVIVGAPNPFAGIDQVGRVYLYYGNAGGLRQNASLKIPSKQEKHNFGVSVSDVGDVNGDGFGDVIVGAPDYKNNQKQVGKAFLYFGSKKGLDSSVGWTVNSEQKKANFGLDVSGTGDVNGDGYDDLIIGAWKYDAGLNNTGKAYVYYGKCSNNPPQSGSVAFNSLPEFPVKDSLAIYAIDPNQVTDTIQWQFPSDWTIQARKGDTSIQVKVGTAGEICLTVANDCGKTDTRIRVEPVNPDISDTTACENESLKLGPYLPTAKSIKWNIGNTTEQIRIDTSGTYAYKAIMQDSTIYRDTAKVTFAPKPKVYIGPSLQAFCGQIDTTLVPETKKAQTYRWNTGDTTKTLYVDEEGQYWLRVASEESCSNADTTRIQEIAYPESFDSSQITACRERVHLDAGNPGASYQWNTGDTSRTLTVNTDGRYAVEIANAYCSIKDTVQVEVDKEAACPKLFVPNAFSPNGDGLNDVFKPEGQKILEYEMTIYNRWGQRIFHSETMDKGWDGTIEGQKAPSGAYMYQIVYRLRNDEGIVRLKTKEGTVQLVR